MAQDLDEEPARIAAGAAAESERFLASLQARLEPDHIAHALLDLAVEGDEEIDGGLLPKIDRGEEALQQGACRLGLQIGAQLAGQCGFVNEGEAVGALLEEEIERVDDRHLGHQTDLDDELARRLGEDEAGEIVRLRVLLPVEEMLRRLDLERIAQDRRAAMRRRAQPHCLRTEMDQTIIAVARPVR